MTATTAEKTARELHGTEPVNFGFMGLIRSARRAVGTRRNAGANEDGAHEHPLWERR
jgi:hypothetical protein